MSSVTGNGYHNEMSGLTREAFTSYQDQFPPSSTMTRALGQADEDFPPYDLLYGLVDLFFKVSMLIRVRWSCLLTRCH
jgi:hypothetical protein